MLSDPALGAVSVGTSAGLVYGEPRPDTAPATGPPPRALCPEPMRPAPAPDVDGGVGGDYHAVDCKTVLRFGIPGHCGGL